MNLFRSFSVEDLRLNLKLAETRIEQLKNKKTNQLKKQRQEIVSLLRDNKQEELARIRTEHMVREDFNIEVLGIIGLLCALLRERTKLLEASASIPYDMKECCTTLVYAADRINDVPELSKIKSQLMLKFKKELMSWLATEELVRENVNERVYEKLSPKPPNAFIVTSYMKHLAEENGLDWRPKEDFANTRFDQPPAAPTGASILPGAGTGIRTPYYVTDGSLSGTAVEPMFKTLGGVGDGGGGAGVPLMKASSPPSSGAVSSMFDNPAAAPLPARPASGAGGLGSATLAAAAASKRKDEAAAKAKQPDFLVLGAEDESTGRHNLFPPAAPVTNNAGAVPDFDELQARFEALKRGE